MQKAGVNVILDVDDVLLDWMGGFRNWLADVHDIIMRIPPGGLKYSAVEECFDMNREKVFSLIAEFSQSSSFEHIQPYPGAVNFLSALSASGLHIHALSACGNGITEEMRLDCLKTYAGWQDEWSFRAIPLGASKYDSLCRFDPDRSILIDDNHKHVLSARRAGLKAIWHRSNTSIKFCPHEDREANEVPTKSWPECGQKLTGMIMDIDPAIGRKLAHELKTGNRNPDHSIRASASASTPVPSGPF